MSNNVWEYIWPWRWQWPLLFVAGVVVSVAIFAVLLILDSIRSNILKKKYKSQTSNITRKFYTFTFDNDLQGTTTSHSWYMWRMFRRFATAALVVSLCSALAVASRPARVFNANEQVSSRDIVLCLDVSGSALPYDREVIQAYLNFIEHFQGERIGLSIFNSTSRTVFPLTDDYRLAKKQL
ncbi:VWA domain-containing protein, partial [Bifidobacteriaceae bacterium NR019]